MDILQETYSDVGELRRQVRPGRRREIPYSIRKWSWMMAKKVLGIDIGHDQLKLALVRKNHVLKTASAPMPEHLLREGRVTSPETMGELIRTVMKESGLHANHAALILPNETVYVKNVHMPLMTVDQLEYNLPFEFNDYITGELKDYIFDYAVLSNPAAGIMPEKTERPMQGTMNAMDDNSASDEEAEEEMELMAVGALRSVLEDAKDILRKAGLRLTMAAPALCAYISLIRAQKEFLQQQAEEYGILDLGFGAVRMYMFRGERHVATRVLEIGLSGLDNAVADAFSVDVHLAHTYLMTNFEGCQQREECYTAYNNIAVELMRALNFYRFSNPDSALSDIWLCGGGAVIDPLVETIGDMLNITLHSADELVPGGDQITDCNNFVQAIGIAMN